MAPPPSDSDIPPTDPPAEDPPSEDTPQPDASDDADQPAEATASDPDSGAEAGAGEVSEADEPQGVELPTFEEVATPDEPPAEIGLLSDVNLNVKIELGRTKMLVEDVLRLKEGGVVELEKLAGDPVDIYVNDRPVARGEVLVLNDNFCVRISEILDTERAGKRPA